MARPALALLLLLSTACGGSEPPAADGADDPASEAPSPVVRPAAASNADVASAPAPDPVPVVRFAAHGPAASTYGPRCGDGIEGTSSEVFRVTAPQDWVYRGTGGGTGPDEISFDLRGSRVVVDLYINREELDFESSFEDRGDTGRTVALGATSVPLHAVRVEDRTGFGIVHVPWMVGLERPGDREGTVLITSREPGLVTADAAAAVLGTVRVERCAAISRTLIWGPASGQMLVAEFEGGDPLGKVRPDEPQPDYVPGRSPLLLYSEAQVAYLLPLEGEVARCVAPLVREDAADDPILHLKTLVPSGTMKEALATYARRCGG